MAIDWSVFAIPKGPSIRLERGWKKRERQQRLEAVYALVDQRDGSVCRVTGRELIKGLPGTVPDRVWHTRHHMKARSTHPEDYFNVRNIFVCAWEAHRQIEDGNLLIEGEDANKRLIFQWNPRVFVNGRTPPFQIRSRRRSQRGGR